MSTKRRRKKSKKNIHVYYDVWIIDDLYKDGITGQPSDIVLARSPNEAAKKVASFRGSKYSKYYMGRQVNPEIAEYMVRPSSLNSPRYNTYWF